MLQRIGLPSDARIMLEQARELGPGGAADYEALGFAAFALGEHQLAKSFYRSVAAIVPNDPQAWYNVATAYRNTGNLDSADEACRLCLALDPGMAQARLLQAHLRKQVAGSHHLDELRAALAASAGDRGRAVFLHYALGKELDDLADHGAAFDHFQTGASLRRASLSYSVSSDVRKLERIATVFSKDHMAAASELHPDVRSVFIVGLPRSGTTLIERVLTGSPGCISNGETDNLLGALMEALGSSGDIFEQVASANTGVVHRAYDRRARPTGFERVIAEKLPMNYLYLGAIRSALPDARVVRIQRNPMDNLFAMYSTLFGEGYPFSYSLEELADYYLAYKRLMVHWTEVAAPQLHDVSYEQFVADPSGQGAALSAKVGIDWTPNMVRIEQNSRPSATASAAQVRRPIYTSAVGRWHAYADRLRPLADKLDAHGICIE